MQKMFFNFPLLLAESKSTNIGKISIILLYSAIYLKDYASIWVDASFVNLILGMGLALGLIASAMGQSTSRRFDIEMGVFMVTILIWIMSTTFTGVFNSSSYFIAIPCAFVIAKIDMRLFIWLLIAHFFLSLFIQFSEYISNEYLFIYQATDGTELNEALFGGSLDIFRAKGMFQGPLSAVAFGLWMAIFFRGNLFITTLLLMSAFLASGRLGMVVAIIIMFFQVVNNRRNMNVNQFLIIAGFVSLLGLMFFSSDEDRLFFILNAFDANNDQNDSRFFFWMKALDFYSSFNISELFFGNFGFINRELGATENDFLRLLLDCGLFGFVAYFSAVLKLIINAARSKDRVSLFMGCLILGLMNIFPFIQSLSSTVLFWVYFFFALNLRHAAR